MEPVDMVIAAIIIITFFGTIGWTIYDESNSKEKIPQRGDTYSVGYNSYAKVLAYNPRRKTVDYMENNCRYSVCLNYWLMKTPVLVTE